MASKLKKPLTTLAPNAETLLPMVQRELIPVLREVRTVVDATTKGTAVITGSRSVNTVDILRQILAAGNTLGLWTDSTTA